MTDTHTEESPPPGNENQTSTKYTAADVNFWFSVCESMGNGKVDFDKLAELCNYKNAHCASNMLFRKRKQMREQNPQAALKVKKATTSGGKKTKKQREGTPADGGADEGKVVKSGAGSGK